jgi:hypothetical protein
MPSNLRAQWFAVTIRRLVNNQRAAASLGW